MADEPQTMQFRDREHFVELLVEAERVEYLKGQQSKAERKRRRKAERREALPQVFGNAVGTVLGGLVLALGAVALGLLDDLNAAQILGLLVAAVGLAVGVFAASLTTTFAPRFDTEAARRSAEATFEGMVEAGLLKQDSPERSPN